MRPALSIDAAFLDEEAAKGAMRRERFAKDALSPPPPPPPKRLAHPGGKIVTSDAHAALHALLLRKIIADEPITESQRHAVFASTQKHNPILSGWTIALTAGGGPFSQAELARLVRLAGGTVSNTVHRRVDVVLASARAVRRDTQKVRKARKLGVPLAAPSLIHASIAAGEVCDPADYPTAPPAPRRTRAVDAHTPAPALAPMPTPAPAAKLPSIADSLDAELERRAGARRRRRPGSRGRTWFRDVLDRLHPSGTVSIQLPASESSRVRLRIPSLGQTTQPASAIGARCRRRTAGKDAVRSRVN